MTYTPTTDEVVQANLAPLWAPPPIRGRSEREDRAMSRRNDAKEDR